MTNNKVLKAFLSLMDNHFSILVGGVLGVLVGKYFPEFGAKYGIADKIFANLMEMCIMPVLITSVSLSLSQFILTKTKINIRKMILMFILFIFSAGLIGILAAELTNPGARIDITSSKMLQDASIENAQITIDVDDPVDRTAKQNLIKIIASALPHNIFLSIASNNYFQVLAFSIILGIALGFIGSKNQELMSKVLTSVRSVFKSVFEAITYVLPIIIFLTLAKDISELGTDVFVSMGSFIICMYFSFLLLFIFNSIVISLATKVNYLNSLTSVKEPLLVAFVTNSGTAAIPSTINTLINKFQLNTGEVNLLASISMIIGQFGVIIYCTFTAIFVAQFYAIDLSLMSYIFIIAMSGVASLVAIEGRETLMITMAIVLTPLGLPSITAFSALLHAIDPIISPFRALILVQTNCAMVSLLATKK